MQTIRHTMADVKTEVVQTRLFTDHCMELYGQVCIQIRIVPVFSPYNDLEMTLFGMALATKMYLLGCSTFAS